MTSFKIMVYILWYIAAGTFMSGIGTLIGLSITATTATAAGVGVGTVGAMATHCIANDFDKLEKALEELKKNFSLLQEIGYKMNDNLQLWVESICTDINNVRPGFSPEFLQLVVHYA